MGELANKAVNGRVYGSINTSNQVPLSERAMEKEFELSRKPNEDPTCYFRDGKRKIDFVLVWEEEIGGDDKTVLEQETGLGEETVLTTKKDAKAEAKYKEKMKHIRWRERFLVNVRKQLETEEEIKQVGDEKIIHYIKMHAPFEVLCMYAEKLSFRAPLQAYPADDENFSATVLQKLHLPNMMSQQMPRYPMSYYTCHFKTSKFNRFLGSENPETFFTETQRAKVVSTFLSETVFGRRQRAEIGIERLIHEDVFKAAYALHCGEYEIDDDVKDNPKQYNDRQVLYNFWARWALWYKYQPLDEVRGYFGEQIALYFAWLGFYTSWLLPASVIGLAVFLYGVLTVQDDPKSQQICAPNATNFTMCPLCDTCTYWNYTDTCLNSKISYLFDHPGTVFFATFISFWAVFFLEFWKRHNANLAHRWDCTEFEDMDEAIRPKYAALAPTTRKNPITGVVEPHFPDEVRLPRVISATVAIAIMIILVLIFIVAVILYRVFISQPLFHLHEIRPQAQLIANTSSAIVNLILIMSLSKVYDLLARKLTEWEMHRTQTEFDDALITKGFLFQFFNFYSSIIYVGFFKGKFSGYPGHYTTFLGLRPEECGNGSCLVELAQSLIIIFVGKQLIGNVQEMIIPKVKTMVLRMKIGGIRAIFQKGHSHDPRWEQDYEMIEYEGLFDEYMEMILQFGFVTIFVAAFPLGPLFALLNNWAEIRLDSQKLVTETRRPVAERAQDIGIWFAILEVIAKIAVISNAFLIAFTSDFLPQMVYKAQIDPSLAGYVDYSLAWAPANSTSEPCRYLDYRSEDGHHTFFYWKLFVARLAFVIVFEHVAFGVQRFIDLAVPDVPESLQLKIKREQFLAREALADTDEITKLIVAGQSRRASAASATAATKQEPELQIISEQ